MQPLDLGVSQPRLGVQQPCDSGEPPRVTRVVGHYQLHPECVQVITGHMQQLLSKVNRIPALRANGSNTFLTAAHGLLMRP